MGNGIGQPLPSSVRLKLLATIWNSYLSTFSEVVSVCVKAVEELIIVVLRYIHTACTSLNHLLDLITWLSHDMHMLGENVCHLSLHPTVVELTQLLYLILLRQHYDQSTQAIQTPSHMTQTTDHVIQGDHIIGIRSCDMTQTTDHMVQGSDHVIIGLDHVIS